MSVEPRTHEWCVCGHTVHVGECGEPIFRTFRSNGLIVPLGRERTVLEGICHCHISEPDDGTDGPSSLPGPRHNSDPYEGRYGTNRRYPKETA